MGLLNLFSNSSEQKLGRCFDKAAIDVISTYGYESIIAGVMMYSAIANTYDNLKHNHSMIRSCGLPESEYQQLLEKVLNKKGREYISNWDQMTNNRQDDYIDIDYYDY